MAPRTYTGKQAPYAGGTVAYLVAYNLLSTVAWSYVLLQTVLHLYRTGGDTSRLYDRVGQRFVRSPLLTIGMQVFSRVMLVWGILYMFPVKEVRELMNSRIHIIDVEEGRAEVSLISIIDDQVRHHPAFTSMTMAWCITECVRYGYYVFNLINSQPKWLVWCR
ncbi:MAG: tyrosine phosphatase-like protein [Olpidium bornovanus]|uniref:Very-long-chain (3R)-3-hydroxyacyl-CoA dehydratase n=1 Tax=Olpidium bornovanus TaxID=278681 RepID=A0A8H8DG67_9FUNG|nr:MAG: tyrosine phosphatase-like protein [Olpidium bornovanus]